MTNEEIHNELGNEESFGLLDTINFTSERKRMSVIVRTPDNQIHLYCKGADSSMMNILDPNGAVNSPELINQALEALKTFSQDGLRTLVMAYRILSEAEYQSFKSEIIAAQTETEGRDKAIERAYARVELDLKLIGCTAIEDELQDEVPETIDHILKVSLRSALLTGISSRASKYGS